MKQNLHITASIDQQELMEDMIERLAYRNKGLGYAGVARTGEWQAVDTSSIEKYVSGTLEVDFENEVMHIPFISSFIFSCTKEDQNPYKLNWSMSLS
jgi:hypothetical protein